MSLVRWQVTMSLDGFVAEEDRPIAWLATDWLPERGRSATTGRVLAATGAIIAGRHWFEEPRPLPESVLVLTRHPEPTPYDLPVSFGLAELAEAVATARAMAGGKDVLLLGADVARHAFAAGLVDEVLVHVTPRLLGAGARLDRCVARLEPIEVTRTGDTAELHYRVLPPGP